MQRLKCFFGGNEEATAEPLPTIPHPVARWHRLHFQRNQESSNEEETQHADVEVLSFPFEEFTFEQENQLIAVFS